MYKLILMLFITALMFGCSNDHEHAGEDAKEHAGDAVDKVKEHAGDAADKVKEHAGDAADSAKAMVSGGTDGPKLEPLPDWDSLPAIEEEHAGEKAEHAGEKASTLARKLSTLAKLPRKAKPLW